MYVRFGFAAADDAAVVAVIEENTREEAAAGARRLAAIAELTRRRVDDDDERANWAFDSWDSAAAEVAAAMTVGHRRASGQMRIAVALRDRLPRVAALYRQSAISSRIAATITWRTQLVADGEALALIDAALAAGATKWGPLSETKLEQAIDARVDRYDPDAVRRTGSSTRSRDFVVGDVDDPAETTSVWGRLLATDAAVLKRRLAAMVHSVCDDDPRTVGERRSDAAGAIAAGKDRLACKAGQAEAGAHRRRGHRANAAAGRADPRRRQDPTDHNAQRGARTQLSAAGRVGRVRADARSVLPRSRLRRARRPLRYRPHHPVSDRADPRVKPQMSLPHTPSHENLRPGARRSATQRHRHLDIAERQEIHHQTLSKLFFEAWDASTADLPPPPAVTPTTADRGLKMPKRRRTRAAEYAARIKAERALDSAPAPF